MAKNKSLASTVPLEEEPLSEATIRFVVEDFSKLKNAQLSAPVYIHNIPWKILVMPRLNRAQNQPIIKGLGYFLQCCLDVNSNHWSCEAKAELRLLNQKYPDDHFSRECKHLFYNQENDWGFSHFMSWNDILDPEKGYIINDTIILEVWASPDPPIGLSLVKQDNTIGDADASSSHPPAGNPSKVTTTIPSVAGYNWTIKDFSKHKKDKIESSTFSSDSNSTTKWNLVIFPSLLEDNMIIRLYLASSLEKIKATFSLSLKTKDGTVIKAFTPVHIFSGPPFGTMKWGWRSKISEIANKVANHNDLLVVSCFIKVYPEYKKLDSLMQSLKYTSQDFLLTLRSDKVFTDVTLESMEGRELQAHKVILAASSQVFTAMFNHDMKEKRENRVKISDLEYSTLALLLSYFYTETLPGASEAEYFKLIYASNKYELPYLTALIEEELMKNIRKDNAINLLILSDCYKAERLKQAVMKYVCVEHSKELCETEDWNDMVASHPHLLNECFIFLCKGNASPPKQSFPDIHPPIDLFHFLAEDDRFTDITLISKDRKELKAHKAILAASSSVFNDKFLCESKESNDKVAVDDVDFATLKHMLEFAFKGTLPTTSIEDSMNLMLAAEKYQFPNLKTLIEHHLISSINAENAVKLLALSEECAAKALKKSVIIFICWESPEEVIETEEWNSLVKSHTYLVNDCFKSLTNPQEHCFDVYATYVTK